MTNRNQSIYARYGVAFGLLFPIVATVTESLATGQSLLEAQLNQPLLWIIDTAPLILGIAGMLIGRRRDEIENAMAELTIFNKKLETANKELLVSRELKNHFLANVSHELRTPLNAIIGFAQLTHVKTLGKISDRQSNNLVRIHESGLALLELVNDLLDLERLEIGALTVVNEDVDLKKIFNELESITAPMAQKKHIELRFELDRAAEKVRSDPVRLRQLVTNLVVNAIKYSDKGKITVRAFAKGMHFIISVQDEGIGISEEDLKTIFDPFRQVDGSSTRAQGGAGLGLNLVKNLTELLGGVVTVESDLGKGSTFQLMFPLHETGSTSEIVIDKVAINTHAKKRPLVFAVGDDQTALDGDRDELESSGYEVRTFLNPKTALLEAKTLRPDLFLVDMVVPGWNGWATLRAMAQHHSLDDIPVVVKSFLEPPTDSSDGNLVAWLSKPVDSDALISVLPKTSQVVEVLVVEDDESTRDLITQQLSATEARIRTATNGADALLILKTMNIDLLILDLMLPEVDGYEVLRKMSNFDYIPETIVFSAAHERPRSNFAKFIGKGERDALTTLTSMVEQTIQEHSTLEASG